MEESADIWCYNSKQKKMTMLPFLKIHGKNNLKAQKCNIIK